MGLNISSYSASLFSTPSVMEVQYALAKIFHRERWMEDMQERIANTRLVDLRIPGTHQSGSFSCNFHSAMCQNCDIAQQLHRGVRYLDLRVGFHFRFHSGEGRVGHGKMSWGTYFEDVIEDVQKFVKDHPKEFLILQIGKSGDLDESHKTYMRERIIELLKEWMVTSEDGFDLKTVTMKDLWQKNKRVWVFFSHELDILNVFSAGGEWHDFNKAMKQGIYPKTGHVYEIHSRTDNKRELIDHLNNEVADLRNEDKNNKLIFIDLFLKPNAFKGVFRGIQKVAEDLQKDDTDLRWFQEQHWKGNKMNVIIMDFIFGATEEYCKNRLKLIDSIISSNVKV